MLQDPQMSIIIMDSFRLSEVNRFVQFLYMGTYKEEPDVEVSETQTEQYCSERGTIVHQFEELLKTKLTPVKDLPAAEQLSQSSTTLSPIGEGATFELSFLNNMHMSVIGSHYRFEKLVKHANEKIDNLLGMEYFDAEKLSQLPHIIEQTRKVTGDATIKEALAGAAAAHLDQLKTMDSFQKLSMISPFALSIMNKLLESGAKTIATAKQKLEKEKNDFVKDLEAEKAKLQSALDTERTSSQVILERQQADHAAKLHQLKEEHRQALAGAQSKYWPELVQARERITVLEKAHSNHKSELENTKSRHWPELVQARARIASYERTVDLLEDVDECRNHGCYYDQFGCSVEVPNPAVSEHPFILRCNNCRCKHPE